jgi:TatD DNase family protein
LTFIDIHTHNLRPEEETISINNLFPEEAIPEGNRGMYYSVGLHPWLLDNPFNLDELMSQVEEKATDPSVIAIGECGLDKFAGVDMSFQAKVFSGHVGIAERLNKPLIIHCVKAYNELIQIRKELQVSTSWIIHGFKGSPETAEQLMRFGFMFSFGKALMNPKPKVYQSFLRIPEELLFLETDESDLRISDLYTAASVLRNQTTGDLCTVIQSNFNRVFQGK